MAATIYSDLSGLNINMLTSYWEKIAQATAFLNANSNGALNVMNDYVNGSLNKLAFYKKRNALSVRDPSSVSARTLAGSTKGSLIKPVLSRLLSDDVSISAIQQDGDTEAGYFTMLGTSFAEDRMAGTLNSMLAGAAGAILSNTGSVQDSTGGNVTLAVMNTAKGKLGDQRNTTRAIFMHSVVYGNLVGALINTANLSVSQVAPGLMRDDSTLALFGAPVFVTDSSSLIDASSKYITLFLGEGAVNVKEMDTVEPQVIKSAGLANVIYSSVAEYNQELWVNGFSYTGAANPIDTALETTSNWSMVASSLKTTAGVALKTDG